MNYQAYKTRYVAALRQLDPTLGVVGAEAVLDREELEVDSAGNVLFAPSPEELAIRRHSLVEPSFE